jgi:hypothetical protein
MSVIELTAMYARRERELRDRILEVWDDRDQREYRNGLVDAYAIVTGHDDEHVHDQLEQAAIARAEVRAAMDEVVRG